MVAVVGSRGFVSVVDGCKLTLVMGGAVSGWRSWSRGTFLGGCWGVSGVCDVLGWFRGPVLSSWLALDTDGGERLQGVKVLGSVSWSERVIFEVEWLAL